MEKKTENNNKQIPHLEGKDGKVIINPKDPKQTKWFEDFKK